MPPQYSGVMFGSELLPAGEEGSKAAEALPANKGEPSPAIPSEPLRAEGGISSLMRNLTFEDLLLIGLIIMLLDSGADDLLLVVLAVLLLAG